MTWQITASNAMAKSLKQFLRRYGTIEDEWNHHSGKTIIIIFFEPYRDRYLSINDIISHGAISAYLEQPIEHE